MYRLTNEDKELVKQTGKLANLHMKTFDDEFTDTLVDVNGTHTVDRLEDGQFLVCKVTVIPGVRYTTNGDGWPDEVELTELTTHSSFSLALADATALAKMDDTQARLEAEAEAEELEEMKLLEQRAKDYFASH